jgi:hypothetical protein
MPTGPGKVNAVPLRVHGKQAPRGEKMTSTVAFHEAGHVLLALMTGRKVVEVWVRGKEGCVEFEPFRWFPGGVARIRRGLAVDVAGFPAETKPDLPPGRVRVTVQPVDAPSDLMDVLRHVHAERAASGHVPHSRAEIDADIAAMRREDEER